MSIPSEAEASTAGVSTRDQDPDRWARAAAALRDGRARFEPAGGDEYRVTSFTTPGTTYRVWIWPEPFCTCPDATYRGVRICKHVATALLSKGARPPGGRTGRDRPESPSAERLPADAAPDGGGRRPTGSGGERQELPPFTSGDLRREIERAGYRDDCERCRAAVAANSHPACPTHYRPQGQAAPERAGKGAAP